MNVITRGGLGSRIDRRNTKRNIAVKSISRCHMTLNVIYIKRKSCHKKNLIEVICLIKARGISSRRTKEFPVILIKYYDVQP